MSSTSEWIECVSKTRNKPYWFNKKTRKSTWTNPNLLEENDEKKNEIITSEEKKTIHSTNDIDERKKKMRNSLLTRIRRKRAEAKEKRKIEAKTDSSNISDDLSKSMEKLNIQQESKPAPSPKPPVKKAEKLPPIRHSRSSSDSDNRQVHIKNGLGVAWSFDVPSHWDDQDIREQIQTYNQSMNPYD